MLPIRQAVSEHQNKRNHEDQIRLMLTDCVRDFIDAKKVLEKKDAKESKEKEKNAFASARKDLAAFLHMVAESRLPFQMKDQCAKLHHIVSPEACSAEKLREALNFCPSRGASGLFKIFDALGRPLLAEGMAELSDHSSDSALAAVVRMIVDMGPVLGNCHSTE